MDQSCWGLPRQKNKSQGNPVRKEDTSAVQSKLTAGQPAIAGNYQLHLIQMLFLIHRPIKPAYVDSTGDQRGELQAGKEDPVRGTHISKNGEDADGLLGKRNLATISAFMWARETRTAAQAWCCIASENCGRRQVNIAVTLLLPQPEHPQLWSSPAKLRLD